MLGIVNGTTNFILDQMDTTGAGFAEALEEAQALGYAEADPTADVEGFDAAAKAAILAAWPSTPGSPPPTCTARASPRSPRPTSPSRHGDGLRRQAARDLRALATRRRGRSRPGAPGDDPAHATRWPASREAFNAVFVEAEAAGQLMFYGRGAGGAPTASAVLGDLVAVARNRLAGGRGAGRVDVRRPAGPADGRDADPLPRRLDVADRPGVLAAVARRVRRARRVDPDRPPGGPRRRRASSSSSPTRATDAALAATVDDLRGAATSSATVASVMRVEGDDE